MDRYGVEGVQLISTQPINLQVNRGQRHGRRDEHQNKDQRKKENKKKKEGLRLKDQVTLMIRHKPNEKYMLDAPKTFKDNINKEGTNGIKKKIDIKV